VDTQQIRDLYASSYRRLVIQMYAMTCDLGEAQDVVQEAFAKALASPRQFAFKRNPEAWLRTVAVNLIRSRWRRQRTLRRILRRPEIRPDSAGASPDHVALVTALRTLPEGQRVAIALHYFADLSIADVAETLGVSVGTVKSRLSRGRQALAAALDEDVDEPSLPDDVREEYSGA
jgi:RNA polymerase sigma-70 factor (ECF subfamily)